MSKWEKIPDWAETTAKSLMNSLKIADSITYEHCLRVGAYSKKLSRDIGLNEYQQLQSYYAGIFHDIGKIGVPKSVIYKPSKLNEEEMNQMKRHPILSEEIISPLAVHPFFKEIIPAVRGHHERIDGKGYPDGLKGDEIPLLARVILVVDAFDAMAENRAYRKGQPIEVIYAELKNCAGTQFDAELVKVFLSVHATWIEEQEFGKKLSAA